MTDAKRSLDVLEVRSPGTEDWGLMTGGDPSFDPSLEDDGVPEGDAIPG